MQSWEEELSSGESASGSDNEGDGTSPGDHGDAGHLLPPPFTPVAFGLAAPQGPGRSGEGIRTARGRLRRGLRIVCVQCREQKRGCDGAYPCQRCFDAMLPCRPVVRKVRGRRRGGGGGGDQQEEKMEDGSVFGMGHVESQLPLLDLALSRTDPLPQAEEFLQVFSECHRERPLDRECALRLVRMWRCMSILMGSDVTWNVAAGICQIMGISAADVVSADEHGPLARITGDGRRSGEARAQRLQDVQGTIAAASERLHGSEAFRRAVRAFPAGTAVHVGGCDGVLPSYGSTAAWTALMKGGLELVEDVVGRRTTHMLLFPRLVAPQDRPLCYRAVIRAVFSYEERRRVEFVKVFSKVGEPRLYILTVQGTQAVEGGWGLIYALEPMPSSRWITDKPHRAATTSYEAPPPVPLPPPSPSSGMTEGVDPNLVFPGMAGLPLSLPAQPPAPPPAQAPAQPSSPPRRPAPPPAERASPMMIRSVLQGVQHARLTSTLSPGRGVGMVAAAGAAAGAAAAVSANSPPPIMSEEVLAALFELDNEDWAEAEARMG